MLSITRPVLTLLLSLFFCNQAFAGQGSALWFNPTDLHLPKPTQVSKLDNGLRLVILPLKRNSNAISARFSLTYPVPLTDKQKQISSILALAIAHNTGWHVEQSLDQTVFNLDLREGEQSQLDQELKALANGLTQLDIRQIKHHAIFEQISLKLSTLAESGDYMLVDGQTVNAAMSAFVPNQDTFSTVSHQELNEFYRTFYLANQSNLVLAGELNSRVVSDKLKALFSHWESEQPTTQRHAQVQLNNIENQSLSTDASRYQITLAVLKENDQLEDSKIARREALLDKLATAHLMRRLKQTLHLENTEMGQLHVQENQVLLTISATSDSLQAVKNAQAMIAQALSHVVEEPVSAGDYQVVVEEAKNALFTSSYQGSPKFVSQQADMLVESIRLGTVYVTKSEQLELINFHTAHLSEVDVSKRIKQLWAKPKLTITTTAG